MPDQKEDDIPELTEGANVGSEPVASLGDAIEIEMGGMTPHTRIAGAESVIVGSGSIVGSEVGGRSWGDVEIRSEAVKIAVFGSGPVDDLAEAARLEVENDAGYEPQIEQFVSSGADYDVAADSEPRQRGFESHCGGYLPHVGSHRAGLGGGGQPLLPPILFQMEYRNRQQNAS